MIPQAYCSLSDVSFLPLVSRIQKSSDILSACWTAMHDLCSHPPMSPFVCEVTRIYMRKMCKIWKYFAYIKQPKSYDTAYNNYSRRILGAHKFKDIVILWGQMKHFTELTEFPWFFKRLQSVLGLSTQH